MLPLSKVAALDPGFAIRSRGHRTGGLDQNSLVGTGLSTPTQGPDSLTLPISPLAYGGFGEAGLAAMRAGDPVVASHILRNAPFSPTDENSLKQEYDHRRGLISGAGLDPKSLALSLNRLAAQSRLALQRHQMGQKLLGLHDGGAEKKDTPQSPDAPAVKAANPWNSGYVNGYNPRTMSYAPGVVAQPTGMPFGTSAFGLNPGGVAGMPGYYNQDPAAKARADQEWRTRQLTNERTDLEAERDRLEVESQRMEDSAIESELSGNQRQQAVVEQLLNRHRVSELRKQMLEARQKLEEEASRTSVSKDFSIPQTFTEDVLHGSAGEISSAAGGTPQSALGLASRIGIGGLMNLFGYGDMYGNAQKPKETKFLDGSGQEREIDYYKAEYDDPLRDYIENGQDISRLTSGVGTGLGGGLALGAAGANSAKQRQLAFRQGDWRAGVAGLSDQHANNEQWRRFKQQRQQYEDVYRQYMNAWKSFKSDPAAAATLKKFNPNTGAYAKLRQQRAGVLASGAESSAGEFANINKRLAELSAKRHSAVADAPASSASQAPTITPSPYTPDFAAKQLKSGSASGVGKALMNALIRTGLMTAGGGIAGAGVGAATAPYDYMPEAALRGLLHGAVIGGSAGLGSSVGQAAGSGVADLAGEPAAVTKGLGLAAGGVGSGLLAGLALNRLSPPAPWHMGDQPWLESVELQTRKPTRATNPFSEDDPEKKKLTKESAAGTAAAVAKAIADNARMDKLIANDNNDIRRAVLEKTRPTDVPDDFYTTFHRYKVDRQHTSAWPHINTVETWRKPAPDKDNPSKLVDTQFQKYRPGLSRIDSLLDLGIPQAAATTAIAQGLAAPFLAPAKYAPEAALIGAGRGLAGGLAGVAAYTSARELGADHWPAVAANAATNLLASRAIYSLLEKGNRPWETGSKPLLHRLRDGLGFGPDEAPEKKEEKGESKPDAKPKTV